MDHGRSDPPRPERPSNDGVFEPVALTQDRPHIVRWGALAVLLLAVVVVKPWDLGTPETGPSAGEAGIPSPGDAAVPTAPLPTRPALVDVIADDFCLDRGRWLAVSVERWRGGTIRSWRTLSTTRTATGPDDPAIPVTPMVSEGVIELGWCAPTFGGDRPEGAATIDAWRRDGGGIAPITLTLDRRLGTISRSGALYATPRRPVSSRSLTWPDGRYVFRHHTDRGSDRWFALELVTRDAVVPPPPAP